MVELLRQLPAKRQEAGCQKRRVLQMRKLVVSAGMLLLFSSLVLAQSRRVVRITRAEGTAWGTQANSISVAWDDGAGKRQTAFVARDGQDRFIMFPTRATAPMVECIPVPRDTKSGYRMIPRLRPVTMDGHPKTAGEPTAELRAGDTILGYETVLQQIGPTTVHYSEDLRIGLKAVSPEGVTEVVLVDDQADFNPRTVDLGIFEQLAAKAEVDGQ